MKTKPKDIEEVDKLQEQLSRLEDLALHIEKARVEINKKIEDIIANNRKGNENKEEGGNNKRNKIKPIKILEEGFDKEESETITKTRDQEKVFRCDKQIKKYSSKINELKLTSEATAKQDIKNIETSKIYLSGTPPNKFKKGDKVKITNHHIGKCGNLYGKIGSGVSYVDNRRM